MNDERREELFTRWLDDKLSAEELREWETYLENHPELLEERTDYLSVRADLQKAIPADVEPPYPDFFNTHLERLIKEASRTEQPVEQKRGAINRLWLWWMAPAATAAVVFAFLLGMKSARQDAMGVVDAAAGSEVYSPLTNVSTEVIVDKESDATLLVVEGLDPLTDTDLAIGEGFIDGKHGFYVNAEEVY